MGLIAGGLRSEGGPCSPGSGARAGRHWGTLSSSSYFVKMCLLPPPWYSYERFLASFTWSRCAHAFGHRLVCRRRPSFHYVFPPVSLIRHVPPGRLMFCTSFVQLRVDLASPCACYVGCVVRPCVSFSGRGTKLVARRHDRRRPEKILISCGLAWRGVTNALGTQSLQCCFGHYRGVGYQFVFPSLRQESHLSPFFFFVTLITDIFPEPFSLFYFVSFV